MAQRKYSRLARLETKRAHRSATYYVLLTIILILVLIFFGIPFLTRFTGFVSNLLSDNSPIQIIDNSPPAPPSIEQPPEFTNKSSLLITGSSEPGSTVNILVNGRSSEVLTNAEGNFNTSITLRSDTNTIKAFALDVANNQSSDSPAYTVTLDTEEPDLAIIKPAPNSQFFGENEKNLVIEGETEPTASVTINERVVIVSSGGKFTSNYPLSEGENILTIKSVDRAGNIKEEILTVTFSP